MDDTVERDAVEREVTLPADADAVWDLLTRPDELAWLGDEVHLDPTPGAAGLVVERDGTRRALVVEHADPGQRLSWHWWPEDDELAPATHVEITLTPDDAGTVLRVVEHVPAGASARASASGAWSHRLLNLEALLLVAAAVRG